ncbi:MAG: hypothetical protein ACR2GW_02420 [Pyrinomonadaceae bacterium]
MRRKLGVILMVVATTLAGTSQASRQFENLKGALAEWTAQGYQPGLLFFAEQSEEIAQHSDRRTNRDAGSSCAAVPPAQQSPARTTERKATKRRAVTPASRAVAAATNHGGEAAALTAQRRQEAAQLRREIAQVARVIDGTREIEKALARIPASERVQMRRALDAVDWRGVERQLRGKFEPPARPAPAPKGAGAKVKVRLPEISRDAVQQGTKRTERIERKVVWHFSTVPLPIDDVQTLAWPDPAMDNDGTAGDDAGLGCQEDPQR